MLRELFIQNMAIIEEARIEFTSGLNVLTGETGTGKSLLVNALDLILGERARGDWIRAGAGESRVEAVFELEDNPEISEILENAGYPAEDILVVKRTVSRSGKNRIYINDRAATLGLLEDLGNRLVDIHGQHEHQSLLRVKRHRELLDLFGGHGSLCKQVDSLYRSCRQARKTLSSLEAEHSRMVAERDLAEYQHDEIARADLKPGEEEELELERKRLLNVEGLREICQVSEQALVQGPKSVLDTLSHLKKQLMDATRTDPWFSGPAEQLETAEYTLEETARELQSYGSSLEGDPGRLEQVEERLDLLYRLKRKYHQSVDDLLALKEDLSKKISRMDNYEEERKKRQHEIQQIENDLLQAVTKLSEARRSAAEKLKSLVEKELRNLGMKETGFQAEIQSVSAAAPKPETEDKDTDGIGLNGCRVDASGADQIEFLISPNPGQPSKPQMGLG